MRTFGRYEVRQPPRARRVLEAVFWLPPAAQLPTAAALWLAAGLVKLSDPFRGDALALVRWRRPP